MKKISEMSVSELLELLDNGNRGVKVTLTNDFVYTYKYNLGKEELKELEDAFKAGILKEDVDDSIVIPKGLEGTFKISHKYISNNTGRVAYLTFFESKGVALPEVMSDYLEAEVVGYVTYRDFTKGLKSN